MSQITPTTLDFPYRLSCSPYAQKTLQAAGVIAAAVIANSFGTSGLVAFSIIGSGYLAYTIVNNFKSGNAVQKPNEKTKITLKDFFLQHADTREAELVRNLNHLISKHVTSSKDFIKIVSTMIDCSPHSLSFAVNVLEQLKWPNPQKNRIIKECLQEAHEQFSAVWEGMDLSTHFVVKMDKIIGKDVDTILPASLIDVIGHLIRQACIAEKSGRFHIEIQQATDNLIPATLIIPLLSRIRNLPNLISLKLMEHSKTGFGDDDRASLLDVLRHNPRLTEVSFSLNQMTQKKRTSFLIEWQQILKMRNFQASRTQFFT